MVTNLGGCLQTTSRAMVMYAKGRLDMMLEMINFRSSIS